MRWLGRFGLLRLTPLRTRAPLRPVNPERLERRRARQFGPPGYRAWLLAHECIPCGKPSFEMAHVISRARGGTWRDCVPMCLGCHRLQHRSGWLELARKTGWHFQALLFKAHELAGEWSKANPGTLARFEEEARCRET